MSSRKFHFCISIQTELPYFLDVPDHYKCSPIHSVLYRDVQYVSYCVQTQYLFKLAQIHISQISSFCSLDNARVTTPGDNGTEIPSP